MNPLLLCGIMLVFSLLIVADPFSELVLELHTEKRSGVEPSASNMRLLTYSKRLEDLAKNWSQKCIFDHPNETFPEYNGLGQNIAWQSGRDPESSISYMIGQWYDEVKDYDFESNTGTGVVGHYTQMVWANTRELGCAKHDCPSLLYLDNLMDIPGEFLVCQYSPPGNYYGQWPYKEGEPCSGCDPDDVCVRNQCASGGDGVASAQETEESDTSEPTDPTTTTSQRPRSTEITSSTEFSSTQESTTMKNWGSRVEGWSSWFEQYFGDDDSGWKAAPNRADRLTM
ncbi:hypothetical protein AAHC03_0161 [Spirometra sp. Aus1]